MVNIKQEILSIRQFTEPTIEVKAIYDILNYKYAPFTRKKSVVPPAEIFKKTVLKIKPLQDYSYLQEEIVAINKFEHKGYIGFNAGLSFAMDEFAFDIPVNNYKGMERTGFSSKTIFGYRITEQIGVNFSVRTNQYSTVGDNQIPMTWNLDAFTAGPILSLPLSEKFRFDFSPSIGFASAYLYVDNKEIYTGGGFAVNISGALSYDISKRWIGSVSSGYLSSKQEFKEGGNGKASDIDIQLGLAYKFGKRNL
jgi:hypothetical protein